MRHVSRTDVLSLSQARLPDIGALGLPVPGYDRQRLRPRIAHVGVGGFHRAHLARYVDELAATGADWGITGLGLLDRDAAMAEALAAQDHLYTLIERGPGEPQAAVVGSITGFVHAPGDDLTAVAAVIAAPETAILSLTVTEGGYAPAANPTFDRLARCLARRGRVGGGPLTVLSCDNLPGNGNAAGAALRAAADRLDPALATWVDEHCVFPSSMVDRITPQTVEADRCWLRERHGLDDRWPVVTEPFRQWILEDAFAAGRPAFEAVGAVFTEHIQQWELYKLRLLNAGHSCIAYLSALAGLELVHEAVGHPVMGRFLEAFLRAEAAPPLEKIPGHPPEAYVTSVLERFANPGISDQIARLCVDGSAKFPTFVMPTVERQLQLGGPVEHAALALAGWARYASDTPAGEMASDVRADDLRRHALAARTDPRAFVAFDAVFPPAVQESTRFRDAFADAYRRLGELGPIGAMNLDDS